jgi:RNA polymerase sigma factor (sigma-70 family)
MTAESTDTELLKMFVTDKQEEAFEELIRRYGPMVLAACRRSVPDEQIAQEAFQATFLVLAKKASSLRPPYALPTWLHKVAYRITSRLRGELLRRHEKEASLDHALEVPMEENSLEWKELRPVLDEELNRMPEKYRAPLVLCYLNDLTNEEAARKLNWSIGSMSRRLDRARELLRVQLTKRGIVFSTVFLSTLLQEKATAAATFPPELLISTKKAAILIATHKAATGVISANVAELMKETVKAMFMEKLKLATAIIVASASLVTAAGVYSEIQNQDSNRTQQATPNQNPNIPNRNRSFGSPQGSVGVRTPQVSIVQQQSNYIVHKLGRLIIEDIEFQNKPIEDVVSELTRISKELDPTHEGVQFAFEESGESQDRNVTLKLKHASLLQVIQSLTTTSGAQFKIENKTLVIFLSKEKPSSNIPSSNR